MPTALELGRQGWKSYIAAAQQRQPAPDLSPVEQQERKCLLKRVKEAAALIKMRYGVERVVLFGSLAHEAWFMPNSDVDVAVQGLEGKDYWEAWRLVEEIIGDRSVDLVQIEMAGESLKRAIRRCGVEL